MMLWVGTDPYRIPFTSFSLSVGLRGCPISPPLMAPTSSEVFLAESCQAVLYNGLRGKGQGSSRRCNESGTPSTRQRWEPEIVGTPTRSYRNDYRRLRPSHSSADESGQTACRSPTDSGDLPGSGGRERLHVVLKHTRGWTFDAPSASSFRAQTRCRSDVTVSSAF